MEISDIIYRRKFTAFWQMQDEYELVYSIVSDNASENIYGVSIAKHTKHATVSQAIKNITFSRDNAEAILRYLYENAVSPGVLPDVMHDIMTENMLCGNTTGE